MMAPRNLFAVLVAPQRGFVRLPHGQGNDAPAPQCLNALDVVAGMLKQQPFKNKTVTTASGVVASHALTNSFDDIAKHAVSGDLVVVMFSGHGSELALVEQRVGGWIFTQGVVGVETLASKLSAFAKGVEVVVISDTCWGHDHVVFGDPANGGVFFTALANQLDGMSGSQRRTSFVFIWSALSLKRRTLAASAFARTLTASKSSYSQLKNDLQSSCDVELEQWGLLCHSEFMSRTAFDTAGPSWWTPIRPVLGQIRNMDLRGLLGLR